MMLGLPDAGTYAAFAAWRADPAQCLPAALDIARAHGLPAGDPHHFATGTNLVVGFGDRLILKVFPPMLRGQFVSERAALTQLRGRIELPIPQIVIEGEREGWPYLVITRLPGILGSEAWPGLPEGLKEGVLEEIGATIAAVQRTPVGPLAAIEPGWPALIERQITGARARHTRLGLPAKYLDGLDGYLATARAVVPFDTPPVILTGEYIPENFLLAESGGRWGLAGLIDFGDVMTGFGEYDLLGPSTFMVDGMPRRLRALLRGYGYGPEAMTPAFRRRLMTLSLLHCASDLVRQIGIEGWQEKARTLDELAALLWPDIEA